MGKKLKCVYDRDKDKYVMASDWHTVGKTAVCWGILEDYVHDCKDKYTPEAWEKSGVKGL